MALLSLSLISFASAIVKIRVMIDSATTSLSSSFPHKIYVANQLPPLGFRTLFQRECQQELWTGG